MHILNVPRLVGLSLGPDGGCSACGVLGTRQHSRRRQRIRDVPVAGPRGSDLVQASILWDESECPRRTLFEATPEVARRARSTRRQQNTLSPQSLNQTGLSRAIGSAHGWPVKCPRQFRGRPREVFHGR